MTPRLVRSSYACRRSSKSGWIAFASWTSRASRIGRSVSAFRTSTSPAFNRYAVSRRLVAGLDLPAALRGNLLVLFLLLHLIEPRAEHAHGLRLVLDLGLLILLGNHQAGGQVRYPHG